MESISLRVGSLVQSSQSLIHDAFLKIERTTFQPKILEVGKWADFGSSKADIDLSDKVLLPGLINAHCHFEFSDLADPFLSRDGTFADWIQQVISSRWARATQLSEVELREERSRTVGKGCREATESGSLVVGDIATRPFTKPNNPCRDNVNFLEVLGLDRERAKSAINWAHESLANDNEQLQMGISPHAPYSTSTWLYQNALKLAQGFRLPLATHLAESTDEIELLAHRSGPLVKLFEQLQVWNPAEIQARSAKDIIDLLKPASQVLLIHGNYLTADQWRSIPNNRNWSIVICPQTHQHFQHTTHPWPQMLSDGVNVAMGTDSRASSQSLNMWEDVKIACLTNPSQNPAKILEMATANSARALGILNRYGTIEPGKVAGFLIADSTSPFQWQELPELSPNRFEI